MPSWYPDYPSHEQFARYSQSDADHFGVTRHVRFDTEVWRAESLAAERWSILASTGNLTTTDSFDAVVVANGHHWCARMPSYPGAFSGTMMHSHDFKRGAPFVGRIVIIVGGGNSADSPVTSLGNVRSGCRERLGRRSISSCCVSCRVPTTT